MATTKTTVKKSAAKKPATRKATTSKQAQQKADTSPVENLTSTMRDATDAGLGFYGTLFDEVQDRIAELRKEAPKRWNAYIKRGQKVRKDINKVIDDQDFAASFDRDEMREQVEIAVEKLKSLLTPAKA